jgi:transcriptional regulator with XRE-family HTH domain
VDRFALHLLRVKAGLKQYELAQLLGVSQTVLCDLERGRRPITPEWERRIRQALTRTERVARNA